MARIHRIGSPEDGSEARAIEPLPAVLRRLAGGRCAPVTPRRVGASDRSPVALGEPLPEPSADRMVASAGLESQLLAGAAR